LENTQNYIKGYLGEAVQSADVNSPAFLVAWATWQLNNLSWILH
jgi:hypothetical protein